MKNSGTPLSPYSQEREERLEQIKLRALRKIFDRPDMFGARNEGDAQAQTREYDRRDLFEAPQEVAEEPGTVTTILPGLSGLWYSLRLFLRWLSRMSDQKARANELRKKTIDLRVNGAFEEADKLLRESDRIFAFEEPKIVIFRPRFNFKR